MTSGSDFSRCWVAPASDIDVAAHILAKPKVLCLGAERGPKPARGPATQPSMGLRLDNSAGKAMFPASTTKAY